MSHSRTFRVALAASLITIALGIVLLAVCHHRSVSKKEPAVRNLIDAVKQKKGYCPPVSGYCGFSGDCDPYQIIDQYVDEVIQVDGCEIAVHPLTVLLKDSDKGVRFCAGNALSRFGPRAKGAVPDLIELLRDQDEDYRSLAADTLGDIGADAKHAVPFLVELLDDKSHCASTIAFNALGRIGPSAKAAVPALIKHLRQSHDLRPMFAAFALKGIGSEARDAIPSLREAAESSESNLVREPAAQALKEIEFAVAVNAGLDPSIQIPDGTPRALVAAVKAAYLAPEPELMGGARPGNWPVVEYNDAMRRVARFGHRAIPILIANIDNPRLKFQAIQILADMRAKETVPLLIDRLELEDSLNDTFLIGALATITEHPKGYEFYRFYFSDEVRQRAAGKYKTWWDAHKNAVRALAPDLFGRCIHRGEPR